MTLIRVQALLFVPEGELAPLAEEVLTAIDSLHLVPSLPQVPLVYSEEARLYARYHPNDGKPFIEVSRRGPHLRLSLTHEIGHLLDHVLGDLDDYSSHQRNSPIGSVLRVIERSRTVRELRAVHQGRKPLEAGAAIRQIHYWLEKPELWARAYAQYVAARAENIEMTNDLQVSQDLEDIQIYKNVQWDSDDFEPIAMAIDAALKKLGWRL